MTLFPLVPILRRHAGRVVQIIAALTALAGFSTLVAAVELDTGFGAGNGYVPVSAPDPRSDTVAAVVRQPDDKFVILGRRVVGGRGVLLLQRYARDATLDMSFGDQGTLTISVPGASLTPRHLYLQESGRLLVAAESGSLLRVRAYLQSGQSDPGFADQGELQFPLAAGAAPAAASFHVLASGAVMAVLQNAPGASLGLTVYRFSRDGLTDLDFGTKGKLILSGLGAGLSYSGVAAGMAGDRIILAVSGSDGVTRKLIQLGRDGIPDPGFGTAGVASPTALQGKTIKRIAPLVSNFFLVAAVAGSGNAQTSTVTRFGPGGGVDTPFAGGGSMRVESADGGSVAIEDVFEQIDNSLLVTGSTPKGMLIARYFQRGVPDPSFNAGRGQLTVPEPASRATQGIASLNFGGSQHIHIGYGLAFGTLPGVSSAPSRAFLISTEEGVPDTSYGEQGIVSLFGRSLAYGEFAQQVLPQADGKVLVLSATGAADGLVGTLSRFQADGNPDLAFGDQGRSSFPLNAQCEWPMSMAMQPDGRIVVLGTAFNAGDCNTSAMVGKRFGVNGALETFSFFYRGAAPSGRSGGLAIQADGKSVITGQDGSSLVVLRFLGDGGADPVFANGGRSLWLRGAGDIARGSAVLIQPDQKIVVAGSMNGTHIVLLRYDSAGNPDSGFGVAGVSLNVIPGTGFLDVQGLAVTPGGRLLVLARSGVRPLLAQFTAAGALDSGFGTGGIVSLLPLYAGGWQYAHFGLAVQPDGGIVVSGQTSDNASSQPALLRLSAAGIPDGAFGTNAIFSWRPSVYFGAGASGVASLNAGNLLAIGYGLPGAMLARIRVADVTAAVVEFYNSQLNHYFVTADPLEQAAVDAGAAGPGWSRTGLRFRAYTVVLGIPPGQSPVCRFYGSTAINPATGLRRGPNSHFYTGQAPECAAVQNDPGWILEGFAFYTRLQEVNGQCAAGTIPVFRLYNNRAQFNDSNHRYTTDPATYQAMQALGWRQEGIVFCVVPG